MYTFWGGTGKGSGGTGKDGVEMEKGLELDKGWGGTGKGGVELGEDEGGVELDKGGKELL